METVSFQWRPLALIDRFGVIHTHCWSHHTYRGTVHAKTIKIEIIDKFPFLLQIKL